MRHFAQLVSQLDQTTRTSEKVAHLADYFALADDADKLWAIALFSGRRPRRAVQAGLLRDWAAAQSGVPRWLVEESYHIAGDLAETLAMILPPPDQAAPARSLTDWMETLVAMRDWDDTARHDCITAAWAGMDRQARFVFNKLLTGGFRVGVSQNLLVKALARHTGQEEAVVAHRLMGDWTPGRTGFQALLFGGDTSPDLSRPYPFFLAYALEGAPDALGDAAAWQAEWKWDGIRSQTIRRGGELFVWSRGEELITDKFPELSALAAALPDGTAIDGELLPYAGGRPLGFQVLQTRIGRKALTKKILQEAPVVIMAYDLLEWQGQDIREWPLSARRAQLAALVASIDLPHLLLSPEAQFDSWEALADLRARARTHEAEGLMLKRRDSAYQVGRRRGDWWKWKVDPLSVDAVMIYAQRGHGRRANLFTDYTFAVWDGDVLVPFAKAYSGLTDAEMQQVDAWVKRHTLERFGPVRSVQPELVFEIGFEGINRSGRHKSGVALRFPRMLRWRRDKTAREADTLATLYALLGDG
ncbi:MAG: ATP-dependent DNA ligase [Bacteroidia bacterium]